MRFSTRTDAGQQLASALADYRSKHPVILALPRGGVPVAAEVAAALNAPLDLILVRKIGLPVQPELAMGAVVDGATPIIIRNDAVIRSAGVSEPEFDAVCKVELAEIERRRRRYLGDRPHAGLAGRVVIVVDDGVATGATMRAALQAVRARRPQELVIAIPVAPIEAIAELQAEVDRVICLEIPTSFGAVGFFYDDFAQVDDATVAAVMARFPCR